MRTLARARFFGAHPTFAIESPNRDYLYGRNVEIDGSTIRFFDERARAVDVRLVGESTVDRLVVRDTIGRRLVFVPVTAAWFNAEMTRDGSAKVKSDAEALERVAAEPFGW